MEDLKIYKKHQVKQFHRFYRFEIIQMKINHEMETILQLGKLFKENFEGVFVYFTILYSTNVFNLK